MNILLILSIPILFTVLFSPIPVKIKIKYANRKFAFKIYNSDIASKITLGRSSPKNTAEKSKLYFLINVLKSADFKNTKFRLPIKLDIKLRYNLGDAAATALAYGIICSLKIFFLKKLNELFHIKKYSDSIEPDFNNSHIKLEITSIIYISLAKIIYIYIKIFKYKKSLT
ncbi:MULTISPECIES: DUF2953 domain-containing protein [Clostridium]|uniref:DUF2953 domain-containing protein n=1 Tax=Clostridium lapidicellarium TaxID=3240931 RepID=A0ABV4DVP5_9CLOT|nr:DUF2953 domain-containing protein [uncultured Clostridium sp.]NLU08103.1 DUF2953 domain-containing protein [Clostridiales bacterium]